MISHQNGSVSLTHNSKDKLTKPDIKKEFELIKERLQVAFQTEEKKQETLLNILDELSEFELGRFLIKNKGALSGYWTWYVILGYQNQAISSPMERFILEQSPAVLATRERFHIFQSLLEKHIQSNSVVCSIPCGMMADLLTLKLDKSISEVRFVGIDLDSTVLSLAKDLAKEIKTNFQCEFFKKDAWNLGMENQFDVITTNGLNLYEKDEKRVKALYRGLFNALKPDGTLICSAMTPPPLLNVSSEWDMSQINMKDLQTANLILKAVLQATWTNFRTSGETCSQLKEAGFKNITIHWDKCKMFPTFSAKKSLGLVCN